MNMRKTIATTITNRDTAYISVMGEHTPGVNSDACFVDSRPADEIKKIRSRIIALVADGITGSGATQEFRLGHFVAARIAEQLPQIFEQHANRSFPKFTPATKNPSKKIKNLAELLEWLVPDTSTSIGKVLRHYPHLLLKPKYAWKVVPDDFSKEAQEVIAKAMASTIEAPPVSRMNLNGRKISQFTAEQMANHIFIAGFRNHPLIPMLSAIDEFLKKIKSELEESEAYCDVKKISHHETTYPGTTLSALVESKDNYFMFSLGDSFVALFDGDVLMTDILPILYFSSVSLVCEAGAVNVKRPFLVRALTIKKSEISQNGKFVLATDGFYDHPMEIINTLSHTLRNKENTPPKKLIKVALKFIKKKEADGSEPPDDKTMIIVRAYPKK
jgi:serine/threonine protein phosphatase PrpC